MTDDIQSDDLLEYARGKLSADMREKVERACEADKALAEELAYYEGLRTAVRGEPFAADEKQWAKLSLAIDELDNGNESAVAANDRGRLWRWAACALGVAFIGQSTFMVINGSTPKSDDAIYSTVTAHSVETQLKVGFMPLATERDITALLLSVDAEIVQGPSALGLYVLGFKSEAEKTAGFDVLSQDANIIETVTEN